MRVLSDRIVREGVQIHRACVQVDDRRARNPDLRRDIEVLTIVVARAKVEIRRYGGWAKVHMPQLAAVRPRVAVGVKGIDVVMLRGDEDDVPRPLAWNRKVGNVQRLS